MQNVTMAIELRGGITYESWLSQGSKEWAAVEEGLIGQDIPNKSNPPSFR